MSKLAALTVCGLAGGAGIGLWAVFGGDVYMAHLAGAFLACF